jgi:branched-chain amino acid transport system permease protein
VISTSCLITQTTSGLIIGLLLFMVAAGVSLIFGVLKVVNFAHGSFYMLGAYFAYTAYQISGSYLVAVLAGGIGVAIFGLLFERLLIARVYGSPVLMQILVCYAVILILDDVVKLVWGPDFLSFGMPETFQALPILFAGGVIPVFYLFLIIVTLVIAVLLGLLITKTRYGKVVRAAAVNPTMVSALGINTGIVYASVFVLGGLLAGHSLLKVVFGEVFRLNEDGWRKLTLRWACFFTFLALLNEVVWRTVSTDTWVSFKVFAIMPLTMVFALSQVGLLRAHEIPAD